MTALTDFVTWAARLAGDEKSESQVFLEHLFQAFGHRSLAESGVVLETRIKQRKGSTSFADLVWPGRVLIEMKSRGEKLHRHYQQAFNYWVHLTPHRPRWVVLCNFDEFWIYDFNQQVGEPMDRVALADLPRQAGALAFLQPQEQTPVFGVNRIQVTMEAAGRVADVFTSMLTRGTDRAQAQRFILQCVVAKFAEDLDLLPRNFFTRLLGECLESQDPPAQAYDLLGGLFRQMNTPDRAPGGRFKDVAYFNGGLFAQVQPVLLTQDEIAGLHAAAVEDWSKVNPDIFGTIFQHSMGTEARHAAGAHYTSEADILKVVHPTIVRPWSERIQAASTLKELIALHEELRRFRVLDPACGSGNFLAIAFRELRRLEVALLLRIRPFQGRSKAAQRVGRDRVSVRQFYGFDILPFAVELAKVTMLLVKELSILEERTTLGGEDWIDFDAALPLDNLDQHIRRVECSLFEPWPEVDAIIGNPPFQSKNKMLVEFGAEYCDRLRAAFPEVPGRADFCVYFFRKAHDHLRPGQRAGLVGTNTIRENYSREGGLDHIVATGGTITEAVSTQHWSGDAAVHVSIVNWIKGTEPGPKRLSRQAEDGTWSSDQVETIQAALSIRHDVTQAKRLSACADGLFCAQGQTHGHEGFLIPRAEAEALIERDPRCKDVLFPFLTADELLSEPGGVPTRYVVDFHPRDLFAAQQYPELFARIKAAVLPTREEAARTEIARNQEVSAKNPKARVNRHHQNFLAKWWILSYPRAELMQKLKTIPRYIACGQVMKRQCFEMIASNIHPNAALVVFPYSDDYSFAILQSSIHWSWFTARCSTLEERFRYTSDSVFDSFPWPQDPTAAQVNACASAATHLRQLRARIMKENGWSLRDLYRAAEQPGRNPLNDAQATLDAAVRNAYGMPAKADALAFLLELNARCAADESRGIAIIGPGNPK